ncbi:MAG: hypothetical protein IJX02_07750 [Clostridia bacterium]|nr:hypothetical protein [Clostridia bacterium]
MKRFIAIISLILTLLLAFSLASCGDSEDETRCSANGHAYAKAWSANASEHFKACTLHPNAILKAKHTDATKDGKCDVCAYVLKPATTFTVTVSSASGMKIKDVTVVIYSGSKELTATTDDKGQAKVDLVYYEDVKARITSLPEGYKYPDSEFTFDGIHLSITLENE